MLSVYGRPQSTIATAAGTYLLFFLLLLSIRPLERSPCCPCSDVLPCAGIGPIMSKRNDYFRRLRSFFCFGKNIQHSARTFASFVEIFNRHRSAFETDVPGRKGAASVFETGNATFDRTPRLRRYDSVDTTRPTCFVFRIARVSSMPSTVRKSRAGSENAEAECSGGGLGGIPVLGVTWQNL